MDKQLPVSIWPEWKIIEKIGEGSFGKVYKAQRTVNDRVFYSAAFSELIVPDSVKTIGYGAFGYMKNIKNVFIPSSVNSLNYAAFTDCPAIANITVDERNESYSSDEYGTLFNKDKTELIKYYCNQTQRLFYLSNL